MLELAHYGDACECLRSTRVAELFPCAHIEGDFPVRLRLSVAISLPTMVVGFIRFSRDSAFEVLRHNRRFVLAMAVGSVVGAAVGGQLLGVVPDGVLLPALAAILVISAVKVWRHK